MLCFVKSFYLSFFNFSIIRKLVPFYKHNLFIWLFFFCFKKVKRIGLEEFCMKSFFEVVEIIFSRCNSYIILAHQYLQFQVQRSMSYIHKKPFVKEVLDSATKIMDRDTEFFAYQDKYQDFDKSAKEMNIDAHNFIGLNVKLCGYGYFEDVQKQMKYNFFKFLESALLSCKKLKFLTITYNGLDVSEGQLSSIFDLIQKYLKGDNTISTLHIKTNRLQKCSPKMFSEAFSLIDKYGSSITAQDLNLELVNWSFEDRPDLLSYEQFSNVLRDFLMNIIDKLNYKTFRLQLSNWYYNNSQALTFLNDAMNPEDVVQELRKLDLKRKKQKKSLQQIYESTRVLAKNSNYKRINDNTKFKQNEGLKFSNHKLILKQLQQAEEILEDEVMSEPLKFINRKKVQNFHLEMVDFLRNLLNKMPEIKEFHIDLRNWNKIFDMESFKKECDNRVIHNNKNQMSLIVKGMNSYRKGGNLEGQDNNLKTTFIV